MKKVVDCLFIGYNETVFEEYEKRIRMMGVKSVEYRDINLNYIKFKNKLYTPYEIFNLFYDYKSDSLGPLSLVNTFSATIAYLGTFLHKKGFTFDYIHSFQDEKEILADKLSNDNIIAVAIPTTFYNSIFPIIEIISFIKKYNTSARIIVGGPFIAYCAALGDENILNNLYKALNADFYIYDSQGEGALANIIYSLKNNIQFDQISNISYKKYGNYYTTPPEIEKNILEDNPVDWSLFSDRVDKLVMIRTSMSCPFSCSFCEYPQRAGKYQTISVDSVEKELNAIYNTGKVKSIGFIDDTFNIPPDRVKNILRMMIRNKYGFRWFSYFRCQYADEEMVELMKESGCDGVILGIESGSQRILQNMNKNVTVEQYRKGIALLNEYGIVSETSLIVGFIGETLETFNETVEFIEETKPTFYHPHVWYSSALAPLWKENEKYGIKGKGYNWSHPTMDSQTAAELVNKMFLQVKNSIWMPQYNFNFPAVISMLTRGMSMNKIKMFINAFNEGVKEKLMNSGAIEVSQDVLDKLKNACNKN